MTLCKQWYKVWSSISSERCSFHERHHVWLKRMLVFCVWERFMLLVCNGDCSRVQNDKFLHTNTGWKSKVQILRHALSTNATPGTRKRSWWWLPKQYKYGMKQIAFCLTSLQLAGKYILSFLKSVANYAEKSWFFKSVNIFKKQLK